MKNFTGQTFVICLPNDQFTECRATEYRCFCPSIANDEGTVKCTFINTRRLIVDAPFAISFHGKLTGYAVSRHNTK